MPKTVSFDLPKSPWEQEREDIAEEKRRIALERMAQLQRPLQGEMISGHYVAPSWTQGLAQAVGQWLGRKDMGHLSEKEKKTREEEQASLVTDVQKWLEALTPKPGTPEQVTEEVGRMVDPEEYWKPAPAETFGLEQAPQGNPLQMETSENPAIADPEALGAALANEYGMSRLPPGTDFKQYTQPPFVPPSMSEIPQVTPQVNQMPPMASAPPVTRRVVPGQPERPANPREALMIALSSKHPMLQQLAMQQLAQQTGTDEGAITRAGALKAMQYLTPESVAKMMGDPSLAQLQMRNDLMTVPQGAAVMGKSDPQGQLLPATKGRFSEPYQRGGDWYQIDLATGKEEKSDNAANVNVGVQTFEPSFGRAQAAILEKQWPEARAAAEAARKDMIILGQAEKALEQNIKTGVLVEPRNYLDKLAVTMGVKSDDPNISNTDLFVRTMRQRAGAILASGAYGAGTGISEKDLQEVIKIASGADMTNAGLAAFIRVAKHANQLTFNEYNRRQQILKKAPGAIPEVVDYMDVDTTTQPAAPVVTPSSSGMSREEKMREIEQLERELGLRK